jgi:hypothetical protein
MHMPAAGSHVSIGASVADEPSPGRPLPVPWAMAQPKMSGARAPGERVLSRGHEKGPAHADRGRRGCLRLDRFAWTSCRLSATHKPLERDPPRRGDLPRLGRSIQAFQLARSRLGSSDCRKCSRLRRAFGCRPTIAAA